MTRLNLVWGEQPELRWRVGDNVAFGARILLDAGGRVAEPIETDAENAERLQQVREHLAVLHTVLRTHATAQHQIDLIRWTTAAVIILPFYWR